MKLVMLLVNSGQFNQEIFEFANLPDFCGDSFLNCSPTVKISLKKYSSSVLFLKL